MTRKLGFPGFGSLGMKLHFMPVGKPAPPRPRRPDALIISMIASWPMAISLAVSSQSPRACAAFKSGDWKP